MGQPIFQPRSNGSARLVGLGFLASGGGVIYWQGVLPLVALEKNQVMIEYSVKLILLGVFCAAFGLLCLIRGHAGYVWMAGLKDRPRTLKTLFGVSFVTALLLSWLIERVFSSYGYSPR